MSFFSNHHTLFFLTTLHSSYLCKMSVLLFFSKTCTLFCVENPTLLLFFLSVRYVLKILNFLSTEMLLFFVTRFCVENPVSFSVLKYNFFSEFVQSCSRQSLCFLIELGLHLGL